MGCNIPSPSPLLCKEGVGEVEVIYPTPPPLTKGRCSQWDVTFPPLLPTFVWRGWGR